jgi:hypothetical protein
MKDSLQDTGVLRGELMGHDRKVPGELMGHDRKVPGELMGHDRKVPGELMGHETLKVALIRLTTRRISAKDRGRDLVIEIAFPAGRLQA